VLDDEFMLLPLVPLVPLVPVVLLVPLVLPVSVPEALEPVPEPEVVLLGAEVPLDELPVLLIDEPVLPVFVVPGVALVALEFVVLAPGPGLAVPAEPLSVLVPLVPVPVLPVLDEPALVPALPPAEDCAYEKPAAASSDAAAAAMARLFEIWFMVG
jgi:signal-induced proliferation-associated 1 like protein 3